MIGLECYDTKGNVVFGTNTLNTFVIYEGHVPAITGSQERGSWGKLLPVSVSPSDNLVVISDKNISGVYASGHSSVSLTTFAYRIRSGKLEVTLHEVPYKVTVMRIV